MKVTVNNIGDKRKLADEQIEIILKETVLRFLKDGIEVEDIKLEEMSYTYTFKSRESEEYAVGSVEHDGITEMFQVNYDLSAKVKEDNDVFSLYTDEERALIKGLDTDFTEIRSVFTDDQLQPTDNEDLGDMVIKRYEHVDGYEVVRIFQKRQGFTAGQLIQEYSIKPKPE